MPYPHPPTTPLHCHRPDCEWARHDIPTVHVTSRARRLWEHDAEAHSGPATNPTRPDLES